MTTTPPRTRTIPVDAPAEFPGTPAEVAANRATHNFWSEVGRCFDCDCRPYSVCADYPCGTHVPRKTVMVEIPA